MEMSKRISEKRVSFDGANVNIGEEIFSAELDEVGVLHLKGRLPHKIGRTVSIGEIDGLDGPDALKLFYIMAGLKYSLYSDVSFEGFEAKEAIDFLTKVLDKDELKEVNPSLT